MTILGLLIFLIVVGIVLYVVNVYIPMDSKIKSILNIAVVLIVILILLQAFGLLGELNRPLPRP